MTQNDIPAVVGLETRVFSEMEPWTPELLGRHSNASTIQNRCLLHQTTAA
jgi:hypothetical protein